MSVPEMFGYLAAVLVFTTFYMKTMVPLRIVAICSNIAGISYGLLLHLPPLFLLHGVMLPLNGWRLLQMRRLIRQVQDATKGEISIHALIPFMTKRTFTAGTVLFRQGEYSGEMFYIVEGSILLEELDISLAKGELFGEVSMFSPSKQRTATAICQTDVQLLSMTEATVMQIFFQNPKFGFYIVRLITRRLLENASQSRRASLHSHDLAHSGNSALRKGTRRRWPMKRIKSHAHPARRCPGLLSRSRGKAVTVEGWRTSLLRVRFRSHAAPAKRRVRSIKEAASNGCG